MDTLLLDMPGCAKLSSVPADTLPRFYRSVRVLGKHRTQVLSSAVSIAVIEEEKEKPVSNLKEFRRPSPSPLQLERLFRESSSLHQPTNPKKPSSVPMKRKVARASEVRKAGKENMPLKREPMARKPPALGIRDVNITKSAPKIPPSLHQTHICGELSVEHFLFIIRDVATLLCF